MHSLLFNIITIILVIMEVVSFVALLILCGILFLEAIKEDENFHNKFK